MTKILSLVLTVVALCFGTLYIVGYTTPEEYSKEITFIADYSPQLTWRELINIKNIKDRKSDVESVEMLEEFGRLVAWKENLDSGGFRIYRMNNFSEFKSITFELTESTYGLTGYWNFILEPEDNHTKVTIVENSTNTNTLLRGYRVIFNRDHELFVWQKYIKVGLVQTLLNTP